MIIRSLLMLLLTYTSPVFAITHHEISNESLVADIETQGFHSYWSGAGPNACHGRCDQDWAIAQLSPDEQAELAEVMLAQPFPNQMNIYDGDTFTMMTYFRDETAYATHHTTIAKLDAPEGAVGWRVGDWAFVKIDACQNWAVVRRPSLVSAAGTSYTFSKNADGDALIAPSVFVAFSGGLISFDSHYQTVVTECDCDITTDPVAPVPLPASYWLILLAFLFLILIKHRKLMKHL